MQTPVFSMRQRGYTLLELAMVLIILGIVSAFTLGGFFRLSDYFVFAGIKTKIISLLEECTAHYFQSNISCTLRYTDGNLTVQSGTNVIRREKPVPQHYFFSHIDTLAIKISPSIGSTGFTGEFKGGTITLCLGGYAEKIIVAARTGRIRFDSNNVKCD